MTIVSLVEERWCGRVGRSEGEATCSISTVVVFAWSQGNGLLAKYLRTALCGRVLYDKTFEPIIMGSRSGRQRTVFVDFKGHVLRCQYSKNVSHLIVL